MALTVYKNHSKTCKKTNQKEFAKRELKEHRFFKNCNCACWVIGKNPLTKKEIRKSLGTTSWEAAEILALRLQTTEPSDLEAEKITIKQAFAAFIQDKKRKKISEATCTSYYTLELCITELAEEHGYKLLSELNTKAVFKLIEMPRWTSYKASSANLRLSNLRDFFRYCIKREWLKSNPAMAIDRAKDRTGMVDPYTPAQEVLLEHGFANWDKTQTSNQGQWNSRPGTMLALKHFLEDTGLRISDALCFQPALATVLPNGDGEWTLIQQKLDGPSKLSESSEVTVYIKQRTLAEIDNASWCSEKYPFMLQPPDRHDLERFKHHLKRQGAIVWEVMQKIGEIAGVEDCRPHRFRHTFAQKMIRAGWNYEKLARFLGHKNTRMIEAHYGKWTQERQDELRAERLLQFEAERAKTNVIEMPERQAS